MGIWDPSFISTYDALHVTCFCKRLNVRREESLLRILYKHTRNETNLIVPGRVLRSNAKMLVKLQRPVGQLYRDSPLYRGSMVWDRLLPADQKILTHGLFMNKIKSKL